MAELTIEQKAKRYDEAISIAREYDFSLTGVCAGDVIQDIFPELKESEDDNIRRWIINEIKIKHHNLDEDNVDFVDKAIAWLEKQGKQKPQRMVSAEAKETMYDKPAWSEEDEMMIKFTLTYFRKAGATEDSDIIKWFKSLRPQNWTKKDKERYISCLQRLSTGNPEQPETINSKWFREHVSPQKQWKPSKEQMEQLGWIAKQNKDNIIGKELMSLYQDLKKLREE